MVHHLNKCMPLLLVLALATTAAPASAEISLTMVVSLPREAKYDVAYDGTNQVYLVVADGPPVRGRFLDKNGTQIGSEFNISLETPLGWTEPYTSWCTVAAGGPAGDPAFLVTYIAVEGSAHTKYGRLVRYRSGSALVSERSLIADVSGQWYAAEYSRAAWAGQHFVVGSRVTGAVDGQPEVRQFHMNGWVSGPLVLGDGTDYQAGPSLACTPNGLCLAAGFEAGIPLGYVSGIWGRLFDANTLQLLSGFLELAPNTYFLNTPNVVFSNHTGRFQTSWYREGYIDFRLVNTDATMGAIDYSKSFGPGAGEPVMAYSPASQTTLLLTKWASYYEGADLWALELGDEGTPSRLDNVILIRQWDWSYPEYRTAIAASTTDPQWVLCSIQGAAGEVAYVQGTGAPGGSPVLAAPTNMYAEAGADAFALSWSDNSPNESDFHIERSTDGSNWTEIAVVPANVTIHWDSGLAPGTYSYRVQAHRHSDGAVSDYSTSAPSLLVAYPGGSQTGMFWQYPTGQVVMWRMNGAQKLTGLQVSYVNSEWKVVGRGDFDGDGHMDLVWQYPTGPVVVWFLVDGAFKGSTYLSTDLSVWRVVSAADFNGDGRPDLVWQHPQGTVVVWLMNGVVKTAGIWLSRNSTVWKVVACGDLNGDGNTDLVWQHPEGSVQVWFFNQTTYVGHGQVYYGVSPWTVVGAVDVNGDSRDDVIWQNPDGRVLAWFMDGANKIGQIWISGLASGWKVVMQ